MKRRVEYGKESMSKPKQRKSVKNLKDFEMKSERTNINSTQNTTKDLCKDRQCFHQNPAVAKLTKFSESSSRGSTLNESYSPCIEKRNSFEIFSQVITDETALKSSYQVRISEPSVQNSDHIHSTSNIPGISTLPKNAVSNNFSQKLLDLDKNKSQQSTSDSSSFSVPVPGSSNLENHTKIQQLNLLEILYRHIKQQNEMIAQATQEYINKEVGKSLVSLSTSSPDDKVVSRLQSQKEISVNQGDILFQKDHDDDNEDDAAINVTESDHLDVIRPRSREGIDMLHSAEVEIKSTVCHPYEILTNELQSKEEIDEKLTENVLFMQDADGDTCLHLAIIQNRNTIATNLIRLMKNETLDIQNKQGQTPLHIAVYLQNLTIIKQLVYYEASVAVVDSNGDTPLHLACRTRLIDIVYSVMYGDSTINENFGLQIALQTKNFNGESPLHVAMEEALLSGNEEIFILLLKANSDINIRENKTGKTCLLMALEKRNYKLANLLINNCANINIATYSGCSPLHVASEYGNIEMIMRLLEKKASLYAKNVELQTPKDVAATEEVRQILEKALKKNRRSRQKEKQLQNLEKRIVNKFSV